MPKDKSNPNSVDVHVGSRVRLRRTMLGLSQENLGEQLGITFQQIQKYEKGTNRIGASRMHQIATILKSPVAYFYEGLPEPQGMAAGGFAEAETANYVVDFLSSSEGLQLNRAFLKIKDPKIRKKIVDLVCSLADEPK